jgi:hypothetical protein
MSVGIKQAELRKGDGRQQEKEEGRKTQYFHD